MEKVELRLWNWRTKKKDVFKPLEPGKVGMYVCGITAYDFSHIGHARCAVNFDILYRYLLHLGYQVTYVRNFTDVDDKIIRGANECGENPLYFSNRYCEEYLVDLAALQCLLPTHQPRVSNHIEQIIQMIEKIIENDCGYVVDGDVFFSLDKCPNYGQFSGQKMEHTRAGERVVVDLRKSNPADFVLWKAAKPGEPQWESPWGPGRPGWHIECSAMSAHYLSPKFDIHGGGLDLNFPHHENEIAMSCAACESSWVAFWLYNKLVTNKNVKMSKSLGNFVTIRDVTAEYHPLALRHFLISSQYRSYLSYSRWRLELSSDALFDIYQPLQDLADAMAPYRESISKDGGKAQLTIEAIDIVQNLKSEFEAEMSDDLNTAHILTGGAFRAALTFIKSSLKLKLQRMQQKQRMSLILSLAEVEKAVRGILDVLGLLSDLSYGEVVAELRRKALARAGMEEEDLSRLIEERKRARKNMEYERSDEIRAELLVKGIQLEDDLGITVWRPRTHLVGQEESEEDFEPPAGEQDKEFPAE